MRAEKSWGVKMQKKLGRYEIREEIGRGAMGVVYKAYDPNINRIVAIKTIHQEGGRGTDSCGDVIGRFCREAKTAGKLSHRSIVNIFDAQEEGEIFYIVMEYIRGRALSEMIKYGEKFDMNRALNIVIQLCQGLHHAHVQGIVHRDVKPANIMVLENDEIRITDFGVAKILASDMTHTGSVLGSPSYMAPEQISGRPVDGRTDVFSTGVVLYELLTGERPFKGEDIPSIIYKIVFEKHPSPALINSELPSEIEEVVDKALEKKPEDRYESAEKFAERLCELRGRWSQEYIGIQKEPIESSEDETVLLSTDTRRDGETVLKAGAERGTDESTLEVPAKTDTGGSGGTSGKKGPLMILSAGVAFVILSLILFFFLMINGEKRGFITITTEPSGAEVYTDGYLAGTTPLRKAEIGAGEHKITLVKEGYLPRILHLKIEAGETREIVDDVLEPLSESGKLRIISEPSGAMVWLDQRLAGTTPFKKDMIPPGVHEISLKMPGYQTWTENLDIPADELVQKRVEMVSEASLLNLSSVPGGAEIFIEGRHFGTTPADSSFKVIEDIGRLEFNLVLKKNGYDPYEERVSLLPGQTTKITGALQVRPEGTLKLKSNRFAEISVDGEKAGETEVTLDGVAAGRHTVVFEDAWGNSKTYEVTVSKNRLTEKTHDFPELSTVFVNSRPWSYIFVNGEKMGQTPVSFKLPPGAYSITSSNPKAGEKTKELTIKEGDKPSLSFELP